MKNLLLFCLFCILLVSCDGKPKSDFKGGDETELNKKITKFIESNDYNSAIALLNLTIQENPDIAYLYNSRALCYRGLYDKDTIQKINLNKALGDITKSISLEPTSERYLFRATIYKQLKKNNEALDNYSLVVNNSQGDQKSDALNERAYFYFSEFKDTSKSFLDFKEAIKINSTDRVFRVYLRYAQCLQMVGHFNEAIDNYFLCYKADKNAIEKNAIKDALYQGLCESLISIGDYLAVVSISNDLDFNKYGSILDLYSKFKLGQEDFAKKEMKKISENCGLRGKYFFEMFPNEPKTKEEELWFKMDQLKWPNNKIWRINKLF